VSKDTHVAVRTLRMGVGVLLLLASFSLAVLSFLALLKVASERAGWTAGMSARATCLVVVGISAAGAALGILPMRRDRLYTAAWAAACLHGAWAAVAAFLLVF
jgi:hypothetical protein